MRPGIALNTVMEAGRTASVHVATCQACQAQQAAPGEYCFGCGSHRLEVRTHDGNGAIYSWVVAHLAFEEELASQVPYAIGVVTLEGGARVYCRLKPKVKDAAPAADLPVTLDRETSQQSGYLTFVY